MAGDRAKRLIGAIYSAAADRLYEPIVVRGAFPLLGGDLNELVLGQGRRAVAVAQGRPILDMPVGTAYFTVEMARLHDGVVVGADIARGMVDHAARAARGRGLDNLLSVQADAHVLPFGDASFGAILCTNGLQVIPGLEPTLAEVARVLAPGGTLFASVVHLPLAARAPTMFKSRGALVAAIEGTGLRVTDVRTQRLATLVEATTGAS